MPAAPVEPPAAPVDDFESFFDTTPMEKPDTSEQEAGWEPSPWDTPDQASTENTEDSNGWFDEAVATPAPDDGPNAVAEEPGSGEQPAEEPQEVPSDGGWWATAMDRSEEPQQGVSDPDSFLESVFSQLGEDEELTEAADDDDDDDETGFSMGLLRRRRMGTAAKDIVEG